MAIIREHGVNLAVELATELTDLEFELLVRERIKNAWKSAHARNPDLCESHNYAQFLMRGADEGEWNIELGETYSKKADVRGQVLSRTLDDAEAVMDRKRVNKLSLLLPAPVEAAF